MFYSLRHRFRRDIRQLREQLHEKSGALALRSLASAGVDLDGLRFHNHSGLRRTHVRWIPAHPTRNPDGSEAVYRWDADHRRHRILHPRSRDRGPDRDRVRVGPVQPSLPPAEILRLDWGNVRGCRWKLCVLCLGSFQPGGARRRFE